jgi:hypothetical protein
MRAAFGGALIGIKGRDKFIILAEAASAASRVLIYGLEAISQSFRDPFHKRIGIGFDCSGT